MVFEKTPNYEEGLDSDTINELSDSPVFSFGADGDTRTVRIHHPDLPASVCVAWMTWHRLGLRDELSASKLARTIEYLRAWQGRRKAEVVGTLTSNTTTLKECTPEAIRKSDGKAQRKPTANMLMLDALHRNSEEVTGFISR